MEVSDIHDEPLRLAVDSPPQGDSRIKLRRSPRAHPLSKITPPDEKKSEGKRKGRSHQRRRNYKAKQKEDGVKAAEADNDATSPSREGDELPTKRPRRRGRKPNKKKAVSSETGPTIPITEVDRSASAEKPKKRKRTPYSKKTWQEQMEQLQHEAERARRLEEQEQKRLERLPPLEKLSADKLNSIRPKAPRNTTQFLIDSHASDEDPSANNEEFDEHGTMSEQSEEILAIREELRKRQRLAA
jgi:hypothetical protein